MQSVLALEAFMKKELGYFWDGQVKKRPLYGHVHCLSTAFSPPFQCPSTALSPPFTAFHRLSRPGKDTAFCLVSPPPFVATGTAFCVL